MKRTTLCFQGIAQANGRQLTEGQKSEIASILKSSSLESAQTHSEKLNWYDMFRGRLKARTLILMSNWICGIVLAYTIALNVSDLSGDVFTNHTISLVLAGAGTLFANALITKLGKNTLFITHWIE